MSTKTKPDTASLWRGPSWPGAKPRDPGRLLQGGNPYLNAALHSLPEFTEAEAAVRRYAEDRAALGQSSAPGSADLVAALADRYQAGDSIDITTEREAFTRADAAARAQDGFTESFLQVGERLLDQRRAIAYAHDNHPHIAEHLSGRLRALIERACKAGVTSDTARIANVSGRHDLPDVAALADVVREFDMLTNAADTYLTEFGFRPTDPRIAAVIKMVADPLGADPLWAVTAAGLHASRYLGDELVDRRTAPILPDFEADDSATIVAFLAEHKEIEVRVPTVAQANKGMETLSAAWREAHACASSGSGIQNVRAVDNWGGVERMTVRRSGSDPRGLIVVNPDTGNEEVWTIHAAPQSLIVG